jgi:hypothetical protein
VVIRCPCLAQPCLHCGPVAVRGDDPGRCVLCGYADFGITATMPRSGLCRGGREGPALGGFGGADVGVVPVASPSRPSTRAAMLSERFALYLAVELGLAKGTVVGYVDAVKPFLANSTRSSRAFAHARGTAVRVRMTCAIRSLSTRCSTPTAPARTRQPRCRCSRPTSGSSPRIDLLVSPGRAGATRARRHPPGALSARSQPMSTLAPTLQAFFTDRLTRQRNASPHTIAAYRDMLRLLLAFAAQRTGKQPCQLDIDDLGAFLDYLEHDRRNSIRTRNGRDPLAVSLRGPRAPRARRARRDDQPRARDPTQAFRAAADHVPHRAGDRRAARRTRPRHLDRPPRSRDAAPRPPNRAQGIRADHAQTPRHSPRHRPVRQLLPPLSPAEATRILAVDTKRGGRARAEQILRESERRTFLEVFVPPTVARRVGPAWVLVRYGDSLVRRIAFLEALHLTKLKLST